MLFANFFQPPTGSTTEIPGYEQMIVAPALPAAFVDGSSAGVTPEQLLLGYPKGDGSWPGTYLLRMFPGMHTIGGVPGRDVGSR
jgi:hypothetical protein